MFATANVADAVVVAAHSSRYEYKPHCMHLLLLLLLCWLCQNAIDDDEDEQAAFLGQQQHPLLSAALLSNHVCMIECQAPR